LCDGSLPDSTSQIFVVVESMPIPSIPIKQMESQLNHTISLVKFNLNDGTRFFLSFIVNCKGEAFHYILLRNDNKELESVITEYFTSNINWTAGSIFRTKNGKRIELPKDVQLIYSFRIDDGVLNILEGDELKHKKKTNRNRKK